MAPPLIHFRLIWGQKIWEEILERAEMIRWIGVEKWGERVEERAVGKKGVPKEVVLGVKVVVLGVRVVVKVVKAEKEALGVKAEKAVLGVKGDLMANTKVL